MLSQQPYLLRALYEWCVNAGYTPYLTLRVDAQTLVPAGYARNGEITLNVHPEAVQALEITDDWLVCSARFGGVAQRVEAPVVNVLAIFARETGEGMSFVGPVSVADESAGAQNSASPTAVDGDAAADAAKGKPAKGMPAKGKPALHIVK